MPGTELTPAVSMYQRQTQNCIISQGSSWTASESPCPLPQDPKGTFWKPVHCIQGDWYPELRHLYIPKTSHTAKIIQRPQVSVKDCALL